MTMLQITRKKSTYLSYTAWSFHAEGGVTFSVLQNIERGKSEERPVAFHLYLSIFHFAQIKEKPWENFDCELVSYFASWS